MALSIVREISSSIRKSPFFSVMADETANQSNKEQAVIVTRYADDDLIAQEEFIGLSVVDSIDAATLTAVIKDCLLRMNLPLQNCRGQCYDGASSPKQVLQNKFQMRRAELFIHITMATPLI